MRLSCLPVLALLSATPALGVTPHLVKDINPVPVAQGSFPQGYATLGRLALFTADDGETGDELWRTDGTVAGTFQLADTCPGECRGNPVLVARTEKLVFFRAFGRGFGPVDLWRSDGSVDGTERLAGPLLLPEPGRRQVWIAGQGVLYFAADDLSHGAELWRSDGTPTGTFQVADLQPGTGGSGPAELTELNGHLYFRADDGVHGPALWTSDGTAEGTRLVRDTVPGSSAHNGPTLLRAVGRTLFFAAPISQTRDGLWKSDGTSGGTSPLLSFSAAPAAPVFLDASVLGSRLLFVASHPVQGKELWTSDGTAAGTRRLTRFGPAEPFLPLGTATSRLLPEASLGNRTIFRADDGVHGVEPWVTNGTFRGTHLLTDVCPGPCSGAAAMEEAGVTRLASGDLLFFSGTNGKRGSELWATDGTATGTRLIRDLCFGGCSSSPFALSAGVGAGTGQIFLLARNSENVPQLWRSDGTAKGTVRLTSFPAAGAFGAALGISLGDAFVFAAGGIDHGRELWTSDGTPQGTRLLVDINREDLGGSFPDHLRSADGKAWFFAQDGVHGAELWVSDGTEEGTRLAHELVPGAGPAVAPDIAGAAESDGRLFFLADFDQAGFALWRPDGRLTSPELAVTESEPLRALGSQVFFVAADAGHGEELWTSDGTAAGTRLLADLEPGEEGSQPRSLTVFQGRLYFTAGVGDGGRELWRSDGTPEGTVLVKDLDARPGRGSDPHLLTEHAGRLFFSAADEEHGLELWSTDGTAAGTVLAAELTPGPNGFFMTHLVSAGTRLFFSGGPADLTQQGIWVSDGTAAGSRLLGGKLIQVDDRPVAAPGVFHGNLYFAATGDQVLWKSDGTEEGTHPLLDADGQEICEPESYQIFDGRLFFSTGQVSGLYQTDGNSPGTTKLLDLWAPGQQSSFELVHAGPRLLFRKWDRLTGSELWALEE